MKSSNGKLALIIIAIILIIDQAVKVWVKTHFYYGEEYEVMPWFKIQFIENNGMAFGMELGSKLMLTWFRIIAVIAFAYYLWRIRHRTDLPKGYVACIAMITAGALGNVIDCIAYGVIFNAPAPPQVAQLFPPDGGYASLFNGRVVDMLYFPLCEWYWPQWMPGIGGSHFVFFQPIFNIADASLSVSVIALILFYARYLASGKASQDDDTTNENDNGDSTTPTSKLPTQPQQ